MLPLTFLDSNDYEQIQQNDVLNIDQVMIAIRSGNELEAKIQNKNIEIKLCHRLSKRQIDILAVGGLINWVKKYKSQ